MESLKDVLHSRGFQVALGASATVAGLALANHLYKRRKYAKARQIWDSQPEDVVVLHQFRRGATTISLSPFPIKVETFLRMNGIKYVNDFDYPYSQDKNKSPWITINGEDISDSQLIIEFLAKKFGIDLGSNSAAKDKAIARSMRVLLEDHLYWILMVERYVHHEARHLKDLVQKIHKVESIHSFLFERYRRMATQKMSTQTYCQGLGRHTKGDLQRMGIEDLQAVSSFLGSKTYMLGGDKPSDLDAVLFGFMCFILYSSPPDSAFKTLVEKRLTNLFQHTRLMKSKYYSDWDKLLQEPALPVSQNGDQDSTKESEKPEPKSADEPDAKSVEKKVVPKEEGKLATTIAAAVTDVILPAPEKTSTPVRKVTPAPAAKPTTPARKLSSHTIERASTPVKKASAALAPVNGASTEPDHTAKPRPVSLNPTQSPSVKRTAAAKTATPAKSSDNTKPAASATATTPKTPLSPLSPMGTTPKSTANSSRKSSITSTPSSVNTSSSKASSSSFSQNSSNKAKVITNGASNVLKSMLGRKK